IIIYAIGIGKAIEEELLEIASEPSYKHLFYAEDFTAMEDISEELKVRICEGPEPTTVEITDVLACPSLAIQHKYLFEDSHTHSTRTTANGKRAFSSYRVSWFYQETFPFWTARGSTSH
ncbi:UNVERIFIED_CONTAM: hypothetical protein H355_001465, partial [Colinus virginianus]